MKLDVLNVKQKVVSSIEVKETLVNEKIYDEEVYRAVVAYLSSKRQGTAKTKTRGEVRGSTRKPWRQKGTGRARVGDKKSPIWRGGGVIFGPTGKQNFTKKQNKKAYKNALLTVLSQRLRENKFICYDNFPITKPQTKAFVNLLKGKKIDNEKILLITTKKNDIIDLSTRNLKKLTYKSLNQVSVYDILNANYIVLDKLAFHSLEEKWG